MRCDAEVRSRRLTRLLLLAVTSAVICVACTRITIYGNAGQDVACAPLVVIVGADASLTDVGGAVASVSDASAPVATPTASGGSGMSPIDAGRAADADGSPVDARDATATVAPVTAAASPSCTGGLTCGGVSCCDAKTLPTKTFMQGQANAGPEHDACWMWTKWPADCDAAFEKPEFRSTVSSFALDTFEVTVGRFRKFVEAYPGSQPGDGAAAHPRIAGSGWDPAWNSSLPTDRAALVDSVTCDPFYTTWTDLPAANENKPINCLDWYTAFAFCAWDGGRLPTEAEWELAASGGEDRVLPWEIPPSEDEPDIKHAIFGCQHNATGTLCTGATNIADVGSVPLGASRWGQLDMAGNVWEWTLDVLAEYATSARTDYANLASGAYRVQRGGSFSYRSSGLRAAQRGYQVPWERIDIVGVRCARRSP
jgi:sulfatase modifying factor 1